jgi:arylformamidase
VPAGYSVSGLFDLLPLVGITPNQDLKLTTETAKQLSPALWPIPSGRVFDAVVGGAESSEFLRQSKLITQAWQGAAKTRYEELPGKNHFNVLDPFMDPQSPMTARVVELARQVQA